MIKSKRAISFIMLLMLVSSTGCGSGSGQVVPSIAPTSAIEVTATTEPTEAAEPTAIAEPTASNTPTPTPSSYEDSDADETALEFVDKLTIGWNLGNTLDSTGGDGKTVSSQETSWGNPSTTLEMITVIKEAGFNTVRIPITWQNFVGEAPDYIIDEAFMKRVQEIVDYCYANEMYVIINMHHEEWYYPSADNYEAASAQLVAMWTQIAENFKNYDKHLIFEGMNEPRLKNTAFEWNGGTPEARTIINQLDNDFVMAVRAASGYNPMRYLMVTTHAASGDEAVLKDFVLPEDERVIVSIHAYTPYNFALNKAGTDAFDVTNSADTKDIDALMERLDRYFISKGIPVIIGEFGAINKDNLEARIAWAGYYVGAAEKLGIPCIWWDNGAFTEGECFGLLSRIVGKMRFQEILDAMFEAVTDSNID